jgi:peptide deformylase
VAEVVHPDYFLKLRTVFGGFVMPILRQIAQLGQPVLREPTRSITDPLEPAVQALIDDLLATTADANGVGRRAPGL